MQISKIKTKIEQTGIKYFIHDVFNVMTVNKTDFNWRCRALKKDISDYTMLKKRYGYLVEQTDWTVRSTDATPKRIWICWFQGEENAPDIVRMCISSVKEAFNDYDIIVITDKNIDEFIQIPQYIKDKKQKGIIKPTHFSDLIRLELLVKYGGIWLDSTVLCGSRKLVDTLNQMDSELFMFKDMFTLDKYIAVSNWFIYAKKQNPFLKTVRNMLFEYWKTENHICNYFLFHLFTCIVAEFKTEEWEKIPAYSCQPPHILQNELFDIYNEKRFDQIMGMSSFHKLSYKFEHEKFEQGNTFYQYLKKLYLEEKA